MKNYQACKELFEPVLEILVLTAYVSNKSSDEPAHPHSQSLPCWHTQIRDVA